MAWRIISYCMLIRGVSFFVRFVIQDHPGLQRLHLQVQKGQWVHQGACCAYEQGRWQQYEGARLKECAGESGVSPRRKISKDKVHMGFV